MSRLTRLAIGLFVLTFALVSLNSTDSAEQDTQSDKLEDPPWIKEVATQRRMRSSLKPLASRTVLDREVKL